MKPWPRMAELSSSHEEERISGEKQGGNGIPVISSPGNERNSSPAERKIHRQEEASKCDEERMASKGISSEQDRGFSSPGFRSAVAMAGWDAETLLMAALFQSPANSRSCQDGLTIAQDSSQAIKDGLRKRDTRTPSSSGPRPRKTRWEGGNGAPIARLPMQPLTLLSDSEQDNLTVPKQRGCPDILGKENCNPGMGTSKEEHRANSKEASSNEPPCLDKLREELSCAVCLDICFEPSTISCGHSFCGTCLRSALNSCGARCPKCRQTVRSEASRKHQINTVLWNTIQILFPQECAVKLQDWKHSCHKDVDLFKSKERPSRGNLGVRPSRLQPWRGYESSSDSDPISISGNFSTSFLPASELMLPRGRSRDVNTFSQNNTPRTTNRHTSTGNASVVPQGNRNPVVRAVLSRNGREMRNGPITQEDVDEDLAARLQQAEVNGSSTAARDLDTLIAATAASFRSTGSRIRHRRRNQRS